MSLIADSITKVKSIHLACIRSGLLSFDLLYNNGESFFPTIKRIIRDIELYGLQVQVLCTDNYPLNVTIFKPFSPEKSLDCAVPFPCDSNRLLFLMFYRSHTEIYTN